MKQDEIINEYIEMLKEKDAEYSTTLLLMLLDNFVNGNVEDAKNFIEETYQDYLAHKDK